MYRLYSLQSLQRIGSSPLVVYVVETMHDTKEKLSTSCDRYGHIINTALPSSRECLLVFYP